MLFFILAAVLVAAGQSAPLGHCDTLTQQLQIQGRDQFLGRWTLAAASTNLQGIAALAMALVDTVWLKSTPANESDAFYVLQVQKTFGNCYSTTSKMTLVNNTLATVQPLPASGALLMTSCTDCMVTQSNYTIGGSPYREVLLLTRRAKVSTAEIEEFKRQVACLNLPPATVLDSDKGFCPDDLKNTADLTDPVSRWFERRRV
ncbi:uncharacterized protein LOC133633587 [Entelurus aequoreus]|uniref:uncharacterized protein LOC133633587 n=1 Tax=Entelurus aequoreus TaxID=161455 RepID=UPI002B1DABFD|nr:uncharacterized protein LOC133633587 [Entelurus aequoreus]